MTILELCKEAAHPRVTVVVRHDLNRRARRRLKRGGGSERWVRIEGEERVLKASRPVSCTGDAESARVVCAEGVDVTMINAQWTQSPSCSSEEEAVRGENGDARMRR